ncbi:hypothetical protein JW710_01085 [Candidatus Dojkabacteria bacterium]|nr:hypothetical protein [Candidatus Dojkabacteria bacterium]
MKRKKFLSLLAVAVMLAGMVVAAVPQGAEAAAITNMSDLMTRLEVSVTSSHDISFDMDASTSFATTETMTFDFNEDGSYWSVDGTNSAIADFDFNDGTERTIFAVNTGAANCTGSTGADDVAVGIDDTTGVVTVLACGSFTASSAGATVNLEYGSAAGGTERVTNPATAGEYDLAIGGTFGDTGEIGVSIVDDDTVNVTGYIDTTLTFDIDTSETDEDCDASGGTSPCDSHSAVTDDAGYVVDLGELLLSEVTASGESRMHADGNTGTNNYIWFDLDTNADGGAVVTVIGANTDDQDGSGTVSALDGSGANEIPSVTSETLLSATVPGYGICGAPGTPTSGTINIEAAYDGGGSGLGNDTYGPVPESAANGGSPASIFNSNSDPVEGARVQFEVGAAPDETDGTGTYTDQLTFIATSTF